MATILDNNSAGKTKSRTFQLTLNQPEKLQELLTNMKTYKSLTYYMVSPMEVGKKTHHEHYHIYLYFRCPIKLNIQKCCGAHVEIARGTYNENLKYLTKTGALLEEWGERPHRGAKTIADLKAMDADEVSPNYYRIKKQLDEEEKNKNEFFDMLDEIEKDELKAPEIIYITGAPGKGKTYSAYKYALSKYKKNEIGKITLKNDFFDIINEDAKCYVIEEFRPSQIKATDFLQLTDKYGYRANVKGGFISLRPEMIIICSVKKPWDIYKDEVNQQFRRRITKEIDLNFEKIETNESKNDSKSEEEDVVFDEYP